MTVRYDLNPDYIPPLFELRDALLCELAGLMEDPLFVRHEKVLARLEEMTPRYALRALKELGWEFKAGRTFSISEMASGLGVTKRHLRLLERLLMILEDVAILRCSDAIWEVMCEPPRVAGMDPDKKEPSPNGFESEPEVLLLDRCGSGLSQVLQGKLDPLQVLFPEGDSTLLARFYREFPPLRAMHILIEKLISRALLHMPAGQGYRILEIGAGTGSTSSYLLPHLPPDRVAYTFTDVSPSLTREAEEEFSRYHFVKYGILNIEGDPVRQGYDSHQFDFAVATNVFHATRDLAETMRHTRQLLKPGGLLVILELTTPTRWTDLIFGLTQGWWRFVDTDLRPSHPILPIETWMKVFREGGFGEAFSISRNDLSAQGSRPAPGRMLPVSLIVGQAPLPSHYCRTPG
jgi:SAM-dependent methyltransferase